MKFNNLMNYHQKLLIKNGLVLSGILLGLLLLSVILLNDSWNRSSNKALLFFGVAYFFVGFFVKPLYDKSSQKINMIMDGKLKVVLNSIKGIKGEAIIFNEINRILDSRLYQLHKNFVLPDSRFDIDALIVGPKGFFAIEIKNSDSAIIFDGNEMKIIVGNKIKCVSKDRDPREECRRHNDYLTRHLAIAGFRIKPKIAVAYSCGEKLFISKNARTGIWIIDGVEQLKEYFDNFSNDPVFTPDYCSQINKFLRGEMVMNYKI